MPLQYIYIYIYLHLRSAKGMRKVSINIGSLFGLKHGVRNHQMNIRGIGEGILYIYSMSLYYKYAVL